MSLDSDTSSWFKSNQSLLFLLKATNDNGIVFGLTRSGLEPTIYHTRDEHTNHYATDAFVFFQNKIVPSRDKVFVSTMAITDL